VSKCAWRVVPLADRLNSREVLAAVSSSLPGNEATRKTEEYWRWKHIDTPFGWSTGAVALSDPGAAVVGVRSFMRWKLMQPGYEHGGEVLSAVRAVDTVTSEAWRGKGIFKGLTAAAINDLQRERVDLIFNTPNQNSAPGYLNMGWKCVGSVALFVRAVRPLRMIYRLLNSQTGASSAWTTQDVQELPLWANLEDNSEVVAVVRSHELARRSTGLRTPRTPSYLSWRYGAHPQAKYRGFLHRVGGQVIGVAVVRVNMRLGLRELVLAELWAEGASIRTLSELLGALCKASDCDYVLAHFSAGSVEHEAIRRCWFVNVPQRRMRLFSRALGQPLPCNIFSMEAWDLSLGDLELF